jgi:hypothetical protein
MHTDFSDKEWIALRSAVGAASVSICLVTVPSSVRSGIFLDVAPKGAELFFAVIFYKYAAPTALKNSRLTTPQNALGSE